jgi:hypothetical protein
LIALWEGSIRRITCSIRALPGEAGEKVMPIAVTCGCGRAMRVKDEVAGKKIRCPGCSAVLTVPKPEAPKDAEAEALQMLMEEGDEPTTPDRHVAAAAPETDAIQRPPAPRPPRPEPPRPEWKWKKKPPEPKPARRPRGDSGGWLGNLNFNPAVVGTGLLMMLGAAVWFGVGLLAGWIYFYPPILFVLGLGTVLKGFWGGRD